MTDVKLSTKGLDQLLKALKAENTVVKVGILGDSSSRADFKASGMINLGGPTNAEIGAIHEFGSANSPMRSFLRMPISQHLEKRLAEAGLFKKENLAEIIRTGSLLQTFKKIGIIAEGIVADAFDTGGFGQWKPSNMLRKSNHQTLVETQQLRNSITSEVEENA